MRLEKWTFCASILTFQSLAWDYEGHRLVNCLALDSLPKDFPVPISEPAVRERIAFLGGEADRWRNTPDLPFRHINNPDHFLDCEYIPELGLEFGKLSPFRYVFLQQFIEANARRPEVIKADPARDQDRTRWLAGFLPWTIAEQYAKLKSSFSYLRVYRELGTREEVENAVANAIYTMGVMGHFVGDATQPLHTTKHYNGWAGENSAGFTTNRTFHSWIDGGFLETDKVDPAALRTRIKPATLIWSDSSRATRADAFEESLAFILKHHELVRPLYQLEKDGKLSKNGSDEGRKFLEIQLVEGAQFLGNLWFTAWQEAGPDEYLTRKLKQQKQGGAAPE